MNNKPWIKKWAIILAHSLAGWGLCGAIIAVGRNLTTMENTLIIHAIGAPIIFGGLSLAYQRFFNYTAPIVTAAVFLSFTILMDFFVVATFIEKSYAMFTSFLGTWLPFVLIFTATYLVGKLVTKPSDEPQTAFSGS
jgi:hypothetical protein